MEKENVVKIIVERIKENEKLFSKEELNFISNNDNIIKKVYLIGVLDNNFNAIFNATPKKSYKKRREME